MTYEEFINKIDDIPGYEAFTSKQLKGFMVIVNSKSIPLMGVFRISKEHQFDVETLYTPGIDEGTLKRLYMLAVELASTPIDERVEHKYNVIVGRFTNSMYLAWAKGSEPDCPYFVASVDSDDLQGRDLQFTDSQYSDLIEYIKTLPDGEFQAKVAEHGKRRVKEDRKWRKR